MLIKLKQFMKTIIENLEEKAIRDLCCCDFSSCSGKKLTKEDIEELLKLIDEKI